MTPVPAANESPFLRSICGPKYGTWFGTNWLRPTATAANPLPHSPSGWGSNPHNRLLAQGIRENYYQERNQRKLLESQRQHRTSDLMTFDTNLCLTNTEATNDSYNNDYVTDIPKFKTYSPTSKNRMLKSKIGNVMINIKRLERCRRCALQVMMMGPPEQAG